MSLSDPRHRQRLIDELSRLDRDDLDDVITAVRNRATTEQAGVDALAAAFQASRSPLAARMVALGDDEEDDQR